MNLAFASISGDADKVNTEIKEIQKVTKQDIFDIANTVLLPENCSTLYYRSIIK
jgi:predicted Zn-dependent peptidase